MTASFEASRPGELHGRDEVDIDRLLGEYAHHRNTGTDPELEAVRTALFVEDAFGIVLADDQLDPALLGDPAALRTLLTGSQNPR